MSSHSFPKQEKLKSRKIISELFETGKAEKSFPVILLWNEFDLPSPAPIQAAFTVSKRSFKRAVDRNRIKRMMREVYRLHKAELLGEVARKEKQIAIMLIYVGKDLPTYEVLEKKIIGLMQRLKD